MFQKFNLCFTLISPFMTGSNEAASFGVDENLPIDDNKCVVFPGTLLRGVLHDVLEECDYVHLNALFGVKSKRESAKQDDFDSTSPLRGNIVFEDFISVVPVDKNDTLTRIKIDNAMGSVEEGALQVVSLPFSVGKEVVFNGSFYLDDSLMGEEVNILKAFKLVPSLGSFKSAGFGKVVDWQCGLESEDKPTKIKLEKDKRYIFDLKIEAPFLVNAERVADNVFQGAKTISGGAIKGAIARVLGANNYENLIIEEARPLNGENNRAPILPFNVIENGKFQIDWKQQDKIAVKKEFPDTLFSLDIKYESRTRTAINYPTSSAKFDPEEGGAVFVYNLVKPEKFIWQFEIVPQEAMSLALNNLRVFIGKMDTPAVLTNISEAPFIEEKATTITLKLETDCIMFDETMTDLRSAYETFFKNALGADVKLNEEFYARQEMVGGWQALRARRKQGTSYYPLIVTKAGSVFTLEGVDETKLNLALNNGLAGYNQTDCYDSYPLSNANGFGEISLVEAI